MLKAKTVFEKCFWLMLLASPFLDLINGIWTYLVCGGDGGMLSSLDLPADMGIGPSLVVRMIFLLIMALYILMMKKWKAIAMLAAVGLCWALTVFFGLRRGDFSLSADLQYIVRYGYCLTALVVYAQLLKNAADPALIKKRTDSLLTLAVLITAVGVLVPYVLGLGFFTYADPLGYRGSRGFFFAGNDITVVMMLLLPLVLAAFMEQERLRGKLWAWLQLLAAGFCFVSMLIIGTKTSFLAIGVTAAAMAVYALVVGLREKKRLPLLRCVMVAAVVGATMLALTLMSETSPMDTITDSMAATGQYMEQAGAETVIFSGRTAVLKSALADLKEALPISALFGVGRGSQSHIIEMDILEVVIYYGVLGAAAMLWLYLSQGVRVVLDLFRCFSLRNLACCVALGLCVGFLFMAGHVLFSVTGGFYFAFLIAYTRLLHSRKGLEAKII